MDCGANLGEWDGAIIFGIDDKDAVIMSLVFFEFEADSLVDATADTITSDGGFGDFFRNYYGKTLVVTGVFCKN